MSKRKREPKAQKSQPPKRPPHPFGFVLDEYLSQIVSEYNLGSISHHITNYIERFVRELDRDKRPVYNPVFRHPHKKWTVADVSGIYASFEGEPKRIYISGMHTPHTVSLYSVAHRIRDKLREQSMVVIQQEISNRFKHVDISNAKSQHRHSSKNKLWLSANHFGRQVVLKTTTDPAMQLTYILEAVIHFLASQRCPTYIPPLHFIGFAAEDRLVVCSEQLQIPSVTGFIHTLRHHNPDKMVWFMVRAVCMSLRWLQRTAQFTHRDCHINNIYYDMRENRVQFIDFDWSCIRWSNKIISVPRHLYDTTRTQYGYNRSVDCCVFLRTLGPALKGKVPTFLKEIYDPLMQRYEDECRDVLKEKARSDTAAMQIFKMSTKDGTLRGVYEHRYGIEKYKNKFEYHMGYYTWTSMTPEAILDFLKERKFF
jgi:hypothetical protein